MTFTKKKVNAIDFTFIVHTVCHCTNKFIVFFFQVQSLNLSLMAMVGIPMSFLDVVLFGTV